MTETNQTPKELLLAAIADLGITMTTDFVPWSQSRNASEKYPSLNWVVRLSRNGREFVATDYSAGSGHCPSYRQGDDKYIRNQMVKLECETGYKARHLYGDQVTASTRDAIKPDLVDVVHSLVSDSDVIDFSSFESWASEFGYDTDSRKAESTYRSCLDIALKLRSAIGEDGLAKLREASEGY